MLLLKLYQGQKSFAFSASSQGMFVEHASAVDATITYMYMYYMLHALQIQIHTQTACLQVAKYVAHFLTDLKSLRFWFCLNTTATSNFKAQAQDCKYQPYINPSGLCCFYTLQKLNRQVLGFSVSSCEDYVCRCHYKGSNLFSVD